MRSEDQYFRNSGSGEVWQRYCGFLDLSIEEFSRIQSGLMAEQLTQLAESPVARRIAPGVGNVNVEDFRRAVAPTTYDDYAALFAELSDDGLVAAPHYWVETSARRGIMKRVPWVTRFQTAQRRNVIAALILSSAREPGDIGLVPGCRVLHLLPGKPFASAWLASGVADEFSVVTIPPLGMDEMTFSRRVEAAISLGLRNGVDYVVAMTSSLVRIGDSLNRFWERERGNLAAWLRLYPPVAWRLYRNRNHAPVLPRDAWSVKGIVSWGADSEGLSARIAEQWGPSPVQMFGSSEGGIMAMQDWRKDSMGFLPDSVFLEFIPQAYIRRQDPPTVLIDELEDGQVYELQITSFYGMPLLRYRQGDLVRIVRNPDNPGGVPRMEFVGRADKTIDMFGIARLDSVTIAAALASVGLNNVEWCLRKELEEGRVLLNFYVDLDSPPDSNGLERRLSRALKTVDRHWGEAVHTMAYNPLRIRPVSRDLLRRTMLSASDESLAQITSQRTSLTSRAEATE